MIIPFRRGKFWHLEKKIYLNFLNKIKNFFFKKNSKETFLFKEQKKKFIFSNKPILFFFFFTNNNFLISKNQTNFNFFPVPKINIKRKKNFFLIFYKFFFHKISIFSNKKEKKNSRKFFSKKTHFIERGEFFRNIRNQLKINFPLVFSFFPSFFFKKIENSSKRYFQNNSLNNSFEITFFLINIDGFNLCLIFLSIFKSYLRQLFYLLSYEINLFTKLIRKIRVFNFFFNKNRNFFLMNFNYLTLLKISKYFRFLKNRILFFFFQISNLFSFSIKKNYFFSSLLLNLTFTLSKKHKKFHNFFLTKKKRKKNKKYYLNICSRIYLKNFKKKKKTSQNWPLIENTSDIFILEIYLKEMIEKKNKLLKGKKEIRKSFYFQEKSFLITLNLSFQKKNLNILVFLNFFLKFKNFSKKFELIFKNNDEKISIWNKQFFLCFFFYKWSFFKKTSRKKTLELNQKINRKKIINLFNKKLDNLQKKSGLNYGKKIETRSFFSSVTEKIYFGDLKDFLMFLLPKILSCEKGKKNFLNFFFPCFFFLKKQLKINPRKISIIEKIVFLWNTFCEETEKTKNVCSKIGEKFNHFFTQINHFFFYFFKKKIKKIFSKKKNYSNLSRKKKNFFYIKKNVFFPNFEIKNFNSLYFKKILSDFFRIALKCQQLDFKLNFLQKFKKNIKKKKIIPWDLKFSNLTFSLSIKKIIFKFIEFKIFLFQQSIKKKKPKITSFLGFLKFFQFYQQKSFEMNKKHIKNLFKKKEEFLLDLTWAIFFSKKVNSFLKFFSVFFSKVFKDHIDYDLKFFSVIRKKKKKIMQNLKNYSTNKHVFFFSIGASKIGSFL
ncbi:hypothetical protein HAN_1g50 (nucleomorph) [Hemiselmis andersenii]|uniref:Uncharacterized protein n=1 Tax=Hemiselmis andersenii TaxID=464988 RepID=A9BK62_HEMAN|nr:hypothetical protein HAN_1g50 [Hemiselmis andersenii]ABW97895.1 hypothetical protein HAN_1g50 [Hemiselmis andersenii]